MRMFVIEKRDKKGAVRWYLGKDGEWVKSYSKDIARFFSLHKAEGTVLSQCMDTDTSIHISEWED